MPHYSPSHYGEVIDFRLISYSSGLKYFEKMPPGVRNSIETMMRPIPRSILLGRGFRDNLNLLLSSDRWKLEELENFQRKRLRGLIDHAYTTVPYYHNLFKANSIHPEDIVDQEDLKRIPILTKEIIRERPEDMKSSESEAYLPGEAHTTGSTSLPLYFLLDQQNREIEYASVWRHYNWGGVSNINARMAIFRGDFVSAYGNNSKLWRWDGKSGDLTFNTYLLNSANIEKMIKKLNEFKPEIIRGYPHALFILCQGLGRSNQALRFKPKVIQTSSEQLPFFMRETIEDSFHTKILDWYSQSEYVISAGQCEQGLYHQIMETGIFSTVEDAWGMERMVGTGLWNYSMPFINYEVGDLLAGGGDKCGCGREHITFTSIEGRINDIIVTTDGRALSGVGIDNYYEKRVLPNLGSHPEYFRIIQENEKTFTLEVSRKGGLSEVDKDFIRTSFSSLLGKDANIHLSMLEETPSVRKWKNVESRLTPDEITRLVATRIE